ncbi:MAG TPA: hypothetical protein VFR23_24695 [Jiangellaceae bacterium]|nr:hypothetical protein [Jiangellaceae bacterium]
MPELAELALATSTNLDELNAAAGNAFIPLADKIKDPQERLKALLTTMRAIAGQGAVGAVEIKDLATEMAGLAAATNKFKGDPAELIKTVGAMAQAARQRGGAATAAEAITPVSRFVTDLASKGGTAFKRQGIDVFANKEQTLLKDPEEIIVDVLKKTGGSLPKISQLFGVYAEKAVAGFSPLFSRDQAEAQLQLEGPNAVKGQARIDLQRRLKSGEFGEAAVRAEFKRLRSAELSPEQQRERAQSRLQDSDLQFKEAMKKFNAAIGSELLPVLTKLVPEFAKLIPSLTTAASLFAKLVESVVKDPVGSVFKLIAAKLVLDLASAGIGNAIRGALLRLVGGAGAGGAGGVGGAVGGAAGAGKFLGKPTAAGVLGAAGIGLAVGGLAASAIYAGGVAKFEAGETNIKGAGQELEQIRGLSGSSSRQEFDAARDALDSLEQRRREASKTTFFDDVLGTFGASNKKVEQKSIDNMVIEAQQKIRDAQAEAARLNVQAAREAGEAFKSAVEGTKPPGPNRGNTPTGDPTRS